MISRVRAKPSRFDVRAAHHHRGRQVVLVDEVAVEHRLGDADLGGDLVHADVAATLPDGFQRAVNQLVSTIDLVLVPAPFAPVSFDHPGWGLLCHYRGHPFPSSPQ
jgi:hypothetical protein